MKTRMDSNVLLIQLERGDEVNKSIAEACAKHNTIKGGFASGIGALSKARIYGTKRSDVLETEEVFLEEPLELVSALGNISMFEGKQFVHLHCTVANSRHEPTAGHLLEGIISFTGEFFVYPCSEIERTGIPEEKMKRWKI